MSIVTTSRGLFSSGQALAEQVAGTMGYRCRSRELLLEAATRYEIPEARLAELLEESPEVTPVKPKISVSIALCYRRPCARWCKGGSWSITAMGGRNCSPAPRTCEPPGDRVHMGRITRVCDRARCAAGG